MFINLTPHEIKIFDQDELVRVLPASGMVARLDKRDGDVFKVDGVTLKRPHFGQVLNLPDYQEGIFLVVSAMVRTNPALCSRTDLVSPADLVRNEVGDVIGCRSFDVN